MRLESLHMGFESLRIWLKSLRMRLEPLHMRFESLHTRLEPLRTGLESPQFVSFLPSGNCLKPINLPDPVPAGLLPGRLVQDELSALPQGGGEGQDQHSRNRLQHRTHKGKHHIHED